MGCEPHILSSFLGNWNHHLVEAFLFVLKHRFMHIFTNKNCFRIKPCQRSPLTQCQKCSALFQRVAQMAESYLILKIMVSCTRH